MRRNDYPWYTENWYDEDLEKVLEDEDIPANSENIERIKKACKGIFDDKSGRFETLACKAREIFGKGKQE